jgi:hypothetical protein
MPIGRNIKVPKKNSGFLIIKAKIDVLIDPIPECCSVDGDVVANNS